MGIKDLWTILAPFAERKPLYELQGKKVAIDLSCWICEAQNISEYTVQPRMYLRNLYFRTCYLLLMDVNPVFVLEGKAPELKYQTIAARNAIQFKGARPRKPGSNKTGKDRSRFNFTLKQCQEMLGYMGIVCIKGNGEAEALCAYLNKDGLVDGIISQDSDCFAYGAQVVYRNFSISQQGAHAASGGSVDVYNIEKAYKNLNFGRNKIIALALLCGSDYCDGVHGIGKDSTLKLFDKFSDEEILDRLRAWRTNHKLFREFEEKLANKNICTSCGHKGKPQSHSRLGCIDCKTGKGCDLSGKYKEQRLAMKNEVNIRGKALQDTEFPNEELIKEFLETKENVSRLNLKWKQPDLLNFVKFTTKYLTWVEVYSFEKFLPILTRWQLVNCKLIGENTTKIVFPERIKKVRNPKGIASYEIIWKDRNNYFTNLIPNEQLDVDLEKLWSTIEPQILVNEAYPDLVEEFQKTKVKPKKKKTTKRKQKTEINEINQLLQNISITTAEPVVKSKKKTIDSYFKQAVFNCHLQQQNNMASTPVKFDEDLSRFGDENDCDLSGIVEDIVSRKMPDYVDDNLERLGFKKIESSFFAPSDNELDLFEASLDKNQLSISDDDEEEGESFVEDNYVPLQERLRQRLLL